MSKEHDWNSRENYFEIHYKTLRFYEKYMVAATQYKHTVVTDRYEIWEAPKIVFTTWNQSNMVHVNIKKDIMIERKPGQVSKAKTFSYRYHVNLPDGRALVRYCSPDDPNDIIDPQNHHTFHHKHIFDSHGKEIRVENVTANGKSWPHVGDFLTEVLTTF